MDPVAYIFTTLVALLAIGMVVLRVREATGHTDRAYILSSQPESPPPDPASVIVPAPRSEAVPAPLGAIVPTAAEPPLRLTKEDVVRALAEVEIVAADGSVTLLSVKAMARLVGMRDADVSALVKEVRGEKPATPKPPAPFEELTKDGRQVATHLRARAR